MNGHHYDRDGVLIEQLNERIVGPSPAELLGIPVRIGVAGGAEQMVELLGGRGQRSDGR